MRDLIQVAGRLLKEGKAVMVHDSSSRENEVDMVYYAPAVEASSITQLRALAGGLICYSMPLKIGNILGLKYMSDILFKAGYKELTNKVLGYGDPPNFSLWVNHKDVVTGIRDADRARTIRELDNVVTLAIKGKVENARRKFYTDFIAPGHVPILLGRGLRVRRGHTELSLALVELNGLKPSTVIAEMLDEGGALPVGKAQKIAGRLGTVLIRGEEILETWEKSHANA